MKKIGPGIYMDDQATLHVDCVEILNHLSIEDTPENRQMVADEAARSARHLYPGVAVEEV